MSHLGLYFLYTLYWFVNGEKMGNNIVRVLILALSIIIFFERFDFTILNLALLLVGIIFSYIDVVFDGFTRFTNGKVSVVVKEVFLCAFCFAACPVPELSVFIPLLGICSVSMGLRVSVVFEIAALIYNFVAYFSTTTVMPMLIYFVAVIGAQFFEKGQMVSASLKKQRDYSREYEMLLEEKNNALTKQQDDMVYTATLQERNRIAREIHDNVGHMLTRSILQLGAIKVVNQDKNLEGPLDDLAETLNLAMTNIRSSVHDLHDESINLESAIKDLTKDIEGFDVQIDYDMGDNIPRDLKYAFIAIIKEGINNTLKHSNGDTIKISIIEQPGFYQLTFSDNGSDVDINYSSGIGLSNINDRVKQMRGNLRITTDNGFSIMVTVMKNN